MKKEIAPILSKIRSQWKPRKKTSHKGDFGHVLVIAGSGLYTGAPYFSAAAALKVGAGLVTLAVPQKIHSILARRSPDLMVASIPSDRSGNWGKVSYPSLKKILKRKTVVVLGPGMGRSPSTIQLIQKLIPQIKQPLIVDADGLFALSKKRSLFSNMKDHTVVTPHAGEFECIWGKVTLENRKNKAKAAAKKDHLVMVLKGHQTIIANKNQCWLNPTGGPALSKGGTGDVLAGLIGGLAAQGFSLWDAAKYGTFIHGFVGDQVAKRTGEASLLASDLLNEIGPAIKKIRGI